MCLENQNQLLSLLTTGDELPYGHAPEPNRSITAGSLPLAHVKLEPLDCGLAMSPEDHPAPVSQISRPSRTFTTRLFDGHRVVSREATAAPEATAAEEEEDNEDEARSESSEAVQDDPIPPPSTNRYNLQDTPKYG